MYGRGGQSYYRDDPIWKLKAANNFIEKCGKKSMKEALKWEPWDDGTWSHIWKFIIITDDQFFSINMKQWTQVGLTVRSLTSQR